jgi:hypothetical protein
VDRVPAGFAAALLVPVVLAPVVFAAVVFAAVVFAAVVFAAVVFAPVDRDAAVPDRDDVDRELDARDVLDLARVAAPTFAAVLRFVAVRLRVVAAFFAAVERDFAPPRALSSMVSASERSSSTVVRTSFDELSPASAIARAARLRSPLERSFLKRSLSSVALAMFSSGLATGVPYF